MSMMEDPDGILSALEFEPSVVAVPIVNVKELDSARLTTLVSELEERLSERRESLTATSDTGRELHSLRAACRIEIFNRGFKT